MSYRVDIEGNIGVVFNIKEYFIVAKFLCFIEKFLKRMKIFTLDQSFLYTTG